MRIATAGIVSTLVLATLSACDADTQSKPAPPARVVEMTRHWQEGRLTQPSGRPGRIALRDAVECGGAWTAVGGVVLDKPLDDRDSAPAAWRSVDGKTWTALDVTATTYWGRRAILSTVACAHDKIVAVGARSGGAHGNPRVTTFFEKDGGLHDQLAAFNLYGGATATNVGPITGADPGWLIAGNRISGPAVWHSVDGRDFTIEEDVPGLADEDGFTSLAQAATWDGAGWVVVGGGNPRSSLDREPLTWVSPDATSWQRLEVPGTKGFDDLERVVRSGDDLVALGLRGDAFGVWRRDASGWQLGETFGSLLPEAVASPFVSSLVAGEGGLWATVSDGSRYALWHSDDGAGWQPVTSPADPPDVGGERILTVAVGTGAVVVLSDDGVGGRVWWSTE